MKLYELLSRHGNFEIIESLISEFPDQSDNKDGHILALHEIRTLKPADTQCQIFVHTVEPDETFPDEERYVAVSGRGKVLTEPDPDIPLDADTNYAIEFDPWEEWLGMEIMPESFDGRSEVIVLAHILYEMTFCGFSNKEIRDARKGLEDSYEDYKKDPSQAVELPASFFNSDDDVLDIGGGEE